MLYTNAKDLYRSSFPKSRFKGSSLPQYNNGGSPMSVQPTFLQSGNNFLASNTGKGISAGAGLAGELISQYGGDGAFAAGASGALKGASAGAQFGLIGAGVGAVGGAAYGLLMRQQELKKEEEAKEQKKQEDLAMNYQTSKAILSTYPTEGVADAGFLAAYGGLIKMDKGGVVQPKGDPYEYKYENGKFLTRKKGSSKWITTSGSAEKAIKEKVFKIKDTPPTDLGLGEAQDPRLQGTSTSDNTNVPVNIQPVSTTIVRPTPGGFDMSLLSNNTLPSAQNVNFRTQGAVEQGYVPKTAEELAAGNSLIDPRLNNNNPSDATYVAPVQQDTRDYVAPTITPNQYDASREQVANQMNSQAVQDALSNIEEPVVSSLATKVLRNVLPPVLPFPGKQMIASSITRDSKFGMDDASQRVQNHLISSVIKARKRSGENKGGTQYIDYNKDIHNDIQNMDVKTIDALAGSYTADDFKAATTFGRVSYEYDPKTGVYKVYDNYDFSKLPSKSKKLYSKLRELAGEVGISDEDTKRNLIGTFKEEDYKDLAVENEYGKAKEVTKKLKDIAPILTKFNMGGQVDPKNLSEMSAKVKSIRPVARQNPDGGESTVLMATETFDGKNWHSFPTIFPKKPGAETGNPKDWIDLGDNPKAAYAEAKKRGEVFDFGEDSATALIFGKGAWKDINAVNNMKAYGGPTDPPQGFDMSMLTNNPIKNVPAPRQDVLTGYSDAELAANRTKGNAIAFQNRADIVGENLNSAYQYVKENPLDAVQVGLGVVAIGADGVPVVGNAVSAGADFINAGISGGRAAYYANQGDADNAAFYSGLSALDLAASAPGAGNLAGATKIGRLINKGIHATGQAGHNIMHAAHTGSQLATTYKGGKLGEGAVDAMSAETPPVAPLVTGMPGLMAAGGKIPTASADYLAEGGEVIQHAVNDRPDTDRNGGIRQLNSNTSLFKGDSHNAPSQGIGVANDQEARIYSKRLYAPKDLVAKLKSL